MRTWTSTTFCETEKCPGHVTTGEYEGTIVMTTDPALPFVVVPDVAEPGLMCGTCGDAVTREDDELVGSDGETTCPGGGRPHGPAVPDDMCVTCGGNANDDHHDSQNCWVDHP